MKAIVIQSTKRGEKYWEEKPTLEFGFNYNTSSPVVAVNTSEVFQTHLGFGGAFTESAAYTLSQISEEKRQEALEAYFDQESGLAYKLGRVHIHSCDFALGNYTYIEEGDKELKTFDISHEHQWVIPMIKDAAQIRGEELMLLASPWSPPAFMKDTKDMNYGGVLLPEFKQSWANYYVKFIEEMKKSGIDIWAITVQNEPEAIQCWDSCIFTAEEERDFVRDYLGPTLEKAGMSDKAIIIWDHNRDVIVKRALTALADPEAAKYIWGVGNHWYISEEFENLSVVHHMFPDKHILFTEGCVELRNVAEGATGKAYIGTWENGERYGRNIIGDFNNYSEGWLDWNLVLNEIGGPNHVHNYCEAPIMANRTTGELIYNPSYYFIGHFSKHIKPGAKRVAITHNAGEFLHATAFIQDDEIIIVIQNEGWIQPLSLLVDGQGVNMTLPDHSITTLKIKK